MLASGAGPLTIISLLISAPGLRCALNKETNESCLARLASNPQEDNEKKRSAEVKKNADSKKQTPKAGLIDRLQNTDFKKKSVKKYLWWWASLKTARRQKPSIRTKRPPREKSAQVVMLYKRRPRTSGWGLLGAEGEAGLYFVSLAPRFPSTVR